MRVEQAEPKVPMTVEEFDQLPDVPGWQFELAEGVLIEMPTPGAVHNHIVNVLNVLLFLFVRERNLGVVYGDNMGYVLYRGPDDVRIPDVSFISWRRIPGGIIPKGSWQASPDLAVEVVSPSDSPREVHRKVLRYLDTGVQLVWVIWPDERTVMVYPADRAPRELDERDELDGEDVLPGFRVRVSELFAMPQPPHAMGEAAMNGTDTDAGGGGQG